MAPVYDMVTVGAGWFGLSAAKAYIELHPTDKVLVLEGSESCGGTWAESRLYPGLKSNNIVGSYEHPDLPMTEATYGVKPGQHVPGPVLHRYLTDFATRFGVYEKIRFKSKVEVVKPIPIGWALTLSSGETIETTKLIIASGLTSTPNIPSYPGQDTLSVPFFHAKDFCARREVVDTAKNVVIIGGAKSAFDVAYAFAEKGVQVDMVIREKGSGPVWLCPPYVTPLKRMTEELLHTRLLTWFSPCPWGKEDGFAGIRNWLHGSAIGRWFVRGFWGIITNDVLTLNAYDKDAKVKELKPWNSILWTGSGVSIHNYETSFWDLVKTGAVRVHTTDVSSIKGNTLQLENGTSLTTDVIVCATGWRKDTTFRFEGLSEAALGLAGTKEEKKALSVKADADVLKMFPGLKDQPVLRTPAPDTDPLRLYRFIVPPTMMSQRNLAFAGMVSTVSTAIFAAAQGLWIAAFFDGALNRVATGDEVTEEVMLHTQWGRWRYPCGYGAKLPDFAFDAMVYVDMLLRDLGLNNHRKKGFFNNILTPYKPKDYAGLVEEWEAAQELKK